MSERRTRRARIWAAVVAVGVLVGLYWWGTGLDFPGTIRWAQSVFGGADGTPDHVALVNIRLMDGGRVDASWSKLADRDLNYSMVEVIAVSPVSYDYGVPYYPGVVDTFTRAYPANDTNKDLQGAGRQERISAGEVWRICVTGMRATPKNVDIAPYIIEGSKACSEDFKLK